MHRKRKLKILAFFPSIGRGGVTRVVETLLPALMPYADVTVLGQTFNENGQVIRYPKDMPFIQVEPVLKLPPHPYQFPFIINNAQVFIEHAETMQDDFDIIWNISPWFSIGAADFVNFKKPLVINIADFAHDHINMGEMLTNYFRATAPKLAARSDYVIFSSDFQRYWAEDHYGFYRAETIHYCTGFSPLPQGNAVHPGLPAEFLLAFHPMGHKDPQTILRAFYYARTKDPATPPLVLAGIGTEGVLDANSRSAGASSLRRLIESMTSTQLRMGKDIIAAGYVAEDESQRRRFERIGTRSRALPSAAGLWEPAGIYRAAAAPCAWLRISAGRSRGDGRSDCGNAEVPRSGAAARSIRLQ